MKAARTCPWRVACAVVPEFSFRVAERRLSPADRANPVVLVEPKAPGRVRAMNAAAAMAGVTRRQTATRARARCPTLICVFWDEAVERAAGQALGEALRQASPHVRAADEESGVFWLDARGMRWLGGEFALAQRVVALAGEAGFPGARVGLADTQLAARLAAGRATAAAPILQLPEGGDAEFVRTLELGELPLDPALASTLQSLGLRRVWELAELPPRALHARFGAAATAALAQLSVEDYRRPDAAPPPVPPEAVLVLEQPVADTGALVFGLRGLAETLGAALAREGWAATVLALSLRLDDHREVVERLVPARPTHHPEAIFERVRDRLERGAVEALSAPVVEVRLQALEVQPASAQQVHLGVERWDAGALERALERFRGRFGQAVVFEAEAREAVNVECAGCWRPVAEVPLKPPLSVPSLLPRAAPSPVRRRLPTPEVVAARVGADGHPLAIHWRGRWQTLDARGPERLSGGWWSTDAFAYEDYRGVLGDGAVLWVRRDARDAVWRVLGWFD